MTKKKRAKHVFRPGGARKLLEASGKSLNDDERALLLALAELEAEHLTEKERAALEKLKAQVETYDPEDLARAVEHMIKAKPKEGSKLEWPELKRRRNGSPK
jgi:hypothetical protein